MKIENFFAELKRRNVYKVAVAYAVVAWLLIQAASIFLPAFDAPPWVMKIFIIVIIFGFPVALIFSWAFEITPEGIKLESEIEPAKSIARRTGRKIVAVTIALAVVAAGLFVYQLVRSTARSHLEGGAPATPDTDGLAGARPSISNKSIAVLPFDNLSRDPDNAYFADGIQDEILSTIGKIGDLKVISRTSTAKYKSRPENLRQVATELGAANVLEGSVQKSGERARIIVQLIDAQSDVHLWSETYDRELKDIFSVESEVAQSIAGALKAKLTPETAQSLDQIPTRDAEAYNLYLKAGYYVREATSGNSDPAIVLPKALDLYAHAIAKDPSFALAWAQVSYVHSWMHWFSVDDSPAQMRSAEDAARRALALNLQLPEAHVALGYVAYWGKREFEQARKALRNNSAVTIAIGSVYRRLDKWQMALDEFYRAAALDPRDPSVIDEAGTTAAGMRRYSEALRLFDRSLAIQPSYWSVLCDAALVHVLLNGRIDKAKEALAQIPAGIDPQGQGRFSRFKVAMWARGFADALKILDRAPDWLLNNPGHRPVATFVLRAQALEASGQTQEAHVAYEHAIPLLEAAINSGADESSTHASLGQAYAGLGRKVDAVREGLKAVELLPVSADAFDGPVYLEQVAEIQARVGNTDQALSLVGQLLDMPAGFVISRALLKLDPAWDSIRGDPSFQKLCQQKQP
jgi:TolB-like protein/Tfp pilus assembly protein PilF